LSQYGSSNIIAGLQSGGGNAAALGNAATVTQGSPATASSGNIASYSQSGTGHSLVIKQ
jgi:hypothetical protein